MDLNTKIQLHKRYSNISFRQIRQKDKLIIEARQGKSFHQNYFNADRLREIVHETYDGHVQDFHAAGVPYRPPAHEIVDPGWIAHMMKVHGIKSKDIVRDLGLDKTYFSAHLNGNREMSNIARAMYYYYFLSKRA